MEQTPEVQIPFSRVAKFVRQFTHDIRNGLSAVDLEAAFIAELVTDPEASEEIRKLRQMVSNTAKMLKELSTNFQPVTLHEMPWRAATFMEELEGRVKKLFPEEKEWSLEAQLGEEQIDIDLEQMVSAALQVLRNAFEYRTPGMPVKITAFFDEGSIVLELRESKQGWTPALPLESWGLQPMASSSRSGYGLGLYQASKILESHGGRLESLYREPELITRMVLPLYKEG